MSTPEELRAPALPEAAQGQPDRQWLSPSHALGRFQHPAGTAGVGQRVRPEAVRYGFRVGSLNLLIKPRTGSEVIKLVQPSAMPNGPPWLAGMINLRSGLVPVFDVRVICALGREESSAQPMILVLDKGEDAVGLAIDGYPAALWGMEPIAHLPQLPTALRGHVSAGYTRDEHVWLEFDHESFFGSLLGPAAS